MRGDCDPSLTAPTGSPIKGQTNNQKTVAEGELASDQADAGCFCEVHPPALAEVRRSGLAYWVMRGYG